MSQCSDANKRIRDFQGVCAPLVHRKFKLVMGSHHSRKIVYDHCGNGDRIIYFCPEKKVAHWKIASTGRWGGGGGGGVDQLMYVLQRGSDQLSQDLWVRILRHLTAETLLHTVSLVNHEWLGIVRQLTSKFLCFEQELGKYYCDSCVRPLPSVPCSPVCLLYTFPIDGTGMFLTRWSGQSLAS